VLFVATPALIVPAFVAARSRWTTEEIALFVFAFGQLGHNLPGMIRAYGDRMLFRQHKMRFIVAPLALLAVSFLFIHWQHKGLILVSALWGIWHALMQTYGMLRIYDAKSKSFAKMTQRLDLAMCVCWFALAVLWSPGRLVMLLDLFFRSGGRLAAASVVGPLTLAANAATIVVTVLFVVHLCRSWWGGSAPSPVKLLLMATSFGFYWYTSVSVSNILLGLAMFEVFHDVQYLAIVWIFNCNRAESGSDSGRFTTFLFRRSGALAGLYLGLIFAYGSLYYLEEGASPGRIKELLTALLATSGLLHYYYDGFIWKLREKSTRKSLRLAGPGAEPPARARVPQWAKHSAKWAAFATPACWFFVAESRGVAPEIQRLTALRDAVPASATVHLDLGVAYQLQGDLDAAAAHYRKAIELDQECTNAYNNLGLLLIKQDQMDAGIDCYQQSLRIDPNKAETYNNLGNALADLGNVASALSCFRKALEIDPKYVQVHNNLALTLAQLGQCEEAEKHLRRAMEIAPDDSATHYNLGTVLVRQKKFPLAAHHFHAVLRIDPHNDSAREILDRIRQLNGGETPNPVEASRGDDQLPPPPKPFESATNAASYNRYDGLPSPSDPHGRYDGLPSPSDPHGSGETDGLGSPSYRFSNKA
jgi:tetratricopeptide (TPR) repeat protein